MMYKQCNMRKAAMPVALTVSLVCYLCFIIIGIAVITILTKCGGQNTVSFYFTCNFFIHDLFVLP